MALQSRRGVSTVLGLMIFIGVLFSSIIPMQLVMQQADNVAERRKKLVKSMDVESSREEILVTVYPNPSNNSELMVRVQNRGDVIIKIVRIWVNDGYTTQSETIAAKDMEVLGPIPVDLQSGTFYLLEATTERGNVFRSYTGSVYYSDGTWYVSALSITVNILNNQGQYRIWVKNSTQHEVGYWDSGGIVHDDIVQSFEVDDSGEYTVIMKKKVSGEFKELSASPATVQITWPIGPPIAYVYGDGDDIK